MINERYKITYNDDRDVLLNWLSAIAFLSGPPLLMIYLGVDFNFDINSPDFNPIIFIIFFFGLYGIYSVYLAITGSLKAKKFGTSTLDLSKEYVLLGETLNGTLKTEENIQGPKEYKFKLLCIETRIQESNNKTKRVDYTLWEKEVSISALGKSSKYGIPFSIEVPKDGYETYDEQAQGTIRWELRIEAPLEGLNYTATFPIEVLRHAEEIEEEEDLEESSTEALK